MRAAALELVRAPSSPASCFSEQPANQMNFKNGPNSPDLRLPSFVSQSSGYSFCTRISPRSLKSMQASEPPSGRTHILTLLRYLVKSWVKELENEQQ